MAKSGFFIRTFLQTPITNSSGCICRFQFNIRYSSFTYNNRKTLFCTPHYDVDFYHAKLFIISTRFPLQVGARETIIVFVPLYWPRRNKVALDAISEFASVILRRHSYS